MKRVLLALTFAAATTAAFADVVEFATVDTDANGAVSFEEALVALPELTEEEFKAADLDASGDLNAEEFATLPGVVAGN